MNAPTCPADLTPAEIDAVIWAIEDSIERDQHNLARHERILTRRSALEKIRRAYVGDGFRTKEKLG